MPLLTKPRMQLAAKASCQLTLRLLATMAYSSVLEELLASDCPGCTNGQSMPIWGLRLSYLPHFTRSLPALSSSSSEWQPGLRVLWVHLTIRCVNNALRLRIHVTDEVWKKSRYTSGLMFYTVFHPSSKTTHLRCNVPSWIKWCSVSLCQSLF